MKQAPMVREHSCFALNKFETTAQQGYIVDKLKHFTLLRTDVSELFVTKTNSALNRLKYDWKVADLNNGYING